MLIFWAVLGGFLLDALFGDPAWLPHPVVLMGRCISALEKHLRTALPKTPLPKAPTPTTSVWRGNGPGP